MDPIPHFTWRRLCTVFKQIQLVQHLSYKPNYINIFNEKRVVIKGWLVSFLILTFTCSVTSTNSNHEGLTSRSEIRQRETTTVGSTGSLSSAAHALLSSPEGFTALVGPGAVTGLWVLRPKYFALPLSSCGSPNSYASLPVCFENSFLIYSGKLARN